MASRMRIILAELKRRRVYQVAAAYGAVGAAIAVAVPDLFGAFGAPSWAAPLVIVLLILGFPIALVLAWALEMTPDGVKRTLPAATTTATSAGAGNGAVPVAAPASAALDPTSSIGRTDDRPGVVVLPFANLGGDPESEAFTDGVTEDIIARMAGIRGLRVISRTTAMTYKGSRQPLPRIAAELGAQAVVEGTVRRAGDRVRVTAQLIAAETDEHLWAETFDRVLQDIFDVQSDVAGSVARALQAELTPHERDRLARQPTTSLEAYELCLKGYASADFYTAAKLEEAERYFREAIALDPGYARAWVGVAHSIGWRAYLGGVPPGEFFPRMRTAAAEAIRLDPGLEGAHLAVAFVAMLYEWEWRKVDRELHAALELNPNDPDVLGSRTYSFLYRERFEEAEVTALRALRLDPLSQARNLELAQVYAMSGRIPEALGIIDAVLERNPHAYIAWNWRGAVHVYAGDLESAATDAEQALAIAGRLPLPLAHRAYVHARQGETAPAREILDELRSRADGEYVDSHCLFLPSLVLDGIDAAIPHLQQMLEDRSLNALYLRAVPIYREVRSDPRFRAALRTIWPEDF